MTAITAPVRYWPSVSAPAIASRAIVSTPTSPWRSDRITDHESGTSRIGGRDDEGGVGRPCETGEAQADAGEQGEDGRGRECVRDDLGAGRRPRPAAAHPE
jgi:hypothetical protein